MYSEAVGLGFRRRDLPQLAGPQRVSQAAIQAAMIRGALVPNSQSISPRPDPLPPAPLLGLVELAAIGIAAALGETIKQFGQLWGSSNSRPGTAAERVNILKSYPIGTKSVDGRTVYRIVGGTVTYYRTSRSPNAPDAVPLAIRSLVYNGNSYVGPGMTFTVEDRGYSAAVYVAYNNGAEVGWDFVTLDVALSVSTPILRVDAIIQATPIDDGPTVALTGDPTTAFIPDTAAYLPQTIPGPLQLLSLPPVAAAAAEGQAAPVATVAATPADPVAVVPAVVAAGALVAVADVLRSLPVVRQTYFVPLLPAADQLRKTTTAGALAPVAVAPVPTTATDARRYGTRTVTAQGARPDLAAIAEEVGRIEQKVGQLLGGMDSTPDWLDTLTGQLINRLVSELLDALMVDVPATTYDFVAPCDKDENGDPIEWSAEIEAADYQPAMVARLDAIAEAMGILKGWKQPLCRATPPRSNVTVTAYEIDPEA